MNFKTTVIVFVLLMVTKSFCQEKNISTATYSVQAIENTDSKLEKLMLEINASANNIISEFTFTLEFNTKKSIFYIDEKLYSDEQAAKIGRLKLKYTNEILQSNDSIFVAFNFGKKKHIIGSEKNKAWTITSETKKINNFLCYKATLVDVVENSKGRFEHPVIAWFCPELPYSFGPLKFGGLPGLIIELQTRDGVFGLTKLSINSEKKKFKEFDIFHPISEKEASNLIRLSKKNSE